jgi:hypothetical protein
LLNEPDGSLKQANGLPREPVEPLKQTDGLLRQADGLLNEPDGSLKQANGLPREPVEPLKQPDGLLKQTDGLLNESVEPLKQTDGLLKQPDGSLNEANGLPKEPNGLLVTVDGRNTNCPVASWHEFLRGIGIVHLKCTAMPNTKTDRQGFATENADVARDLSSKGDPVTGLGNPSGKHGISSPYNEDLQTQITAKGSKKKAQKKP